MSLKKIEINIASYPDDCKRIQEVLMKKGYEASISDCEVLWERYSYSVCAGWMIVDTLSDEEIFDCILPYIDN